MVFTRNTNKTTMTAILFILDIAGDQVDKTGGLTYIIQRQIYTYL